MFYPLGKKIKKNLMGGRGGGFLYVRGLIRPSMKSHLVKNAIMARSSIRY